MKIFKKKKNSRVILMTTKAKKNYNDFKFKKKIHFLVEKVKEYKK